MPRGEYKSVSLTPVAVAALQMAREEIERMGTARLPADLRPGELTISDVVEMAAASLRWRLRKGAAR
jgi:hypothetical protein